MFPSRVISVLVADDHSVVREGIRRVIETEMDIKVCAEAENGMEVIAVSPSTLLSKWVGESERTVARLFEQAKAGSGGCVLFFDECDSFALDRSAAPSACGAGSNVLLEMLIQVGRERVRRQTFIRLAC